MWILFAALATCGAAAMPLLHQHFKPDSASMLFWMRVTSFLALAPIVFWMGAPQNPWFYIGTLGIAVWMSINDVIYFNAVKKHGAGVITRILPGAAILTFFLWFAFDWDLISVYIANPGRSIIILAIMLFGVWCAAHLTRDAVSIAAVRDIWFVLLSATIGPIIVKIVLSFAPHAVGPLAFVAVQGIIVAVLYLGHHLKTQTVPPAIFFGRASLRIGAIIALASILSIGARGYAIQYVDNPAYVSMVALTAPVLIAAVERALGHQDSSNQWAGFGLVIAAILLAVFKLT
jgi:hypothetical protein